MGILPGIRRCGMYSFSSRHADGSFGGEAGMNGGAPLIIAYGYAEAIRRAYHRALKDAARARSSLVALTVTDLWGRPIYHDGIHYRPTGKGARA